MTNAAAAGMPAANPVSVMVSERYALRHALATERVRARQYREAMAQAGDKRQRGLCGRKLDASLGRAAKLALALVDMGEAIPMTGVCADFDSRLLEAMDMAVRNARMPAIARGLAAGARSTRTGHGTT